MAGYLAAAAAETESRSVPFPRTPRVVRVAANLDAPSAGEKRTWLSRVAQGERVRDGIPRYIVRPTRRLLPLEFIDGVKPTDTAKIASIRPQGPVGVLEDLATAFAHNIFIDGVFNADPHAGNILVSRSEGGRVVLLDFGMTKRLHKKVRLAIARLVVSAADGDVSGVLKAIRNLGLDAVIGDPSAAVNVMRFLFRDAAPQMAVGRAQHQEWHAPPTSTNVRRKIKERMPTHGQERFRRSDSEVGEEDPADGLLLDENPDCSRGRSQEYLSQATGKLVAKYATPGTILFVIRVISCLRGIATSLGVEQSYLRALRPHARRALEKHYGNASAHIERRMTPLQQRVVSMMRRHIESAAACGIALCAFVDGEVVLNESCGEFGPADPRPIKPDSLFSVFSCGKGIAAALTIALVEDGAIDLDTPFVQQRNARLRTFFVDEHSEDNSSLLGHVLTPRSLLEHTSGLATAFPPKFASALRNLDADYFSCGRKVWREAVRWIRTRAKFVHDELGKFRYHAVSFGWLVGSMCEQATGVPYDKLLELRLTRSLGVDKHVYACLPYPSSQTAIISDESEVNDDEDAEVWSRLTTVCVRNEDLANFGNLSEDVIGYDPRLINEPSLRSLLLPSSTMHCSAYGCATIYAALANGGKLSDGRRFLSEDATKSLATQFTRSCSACVFMHREKNFESACRYCTGVSQKCVPFGFRPYVLKGGDRSDSSSENRYALGHAGLGQLHCFGDPVSGIAISCLVNELSSDPTCAEDLLKFTLKELGGGTLELFE